MERLDPASARDALFQPLENGGFDLALSATERDQLIERSQCYPHFVQCIGRALWDAAEESGYRVVDREVLDDARPAWEEEIRTMYNSRLTELDRRRLIPYAEGIAKMFIDHGPYISTESIRTSIQERGPADVTQVETDLEALGYIWRSAENALEYEPGIPSLMDFVRGRVRGLEERNPERSLDDDLGLEL
jgi:hypothetical protein